MASITSITLQERQNLNQLHDLFAQKVKLTGCSVVAASFLLIGALIVITSGCLCLTLPGVNVINHVLLPAIIPGTLAIIVSLPFILHAVKYAYDKNYVREEMITTMTSLLDSYHVPEMPRKARKNFILKNILNWQSDPQDSNKLVKNTSWTAEYQGKILGDIKEKIGKNKKDRNPRQEKIATALDKARAEIAEKKKKKKNNKK